MSSSGELGYLLRNSFSSNDFALYSLWSAGFMRAMLLCCKASRARPSTRRVEVVATEMCVCVCGNLANVACFEVLGRPLENSNQRRCNHQV